METCHRTDLESNQGQEGLVVGRRQVKSLQWPARLVGGGVVQMVVKRWLMGFANILKYSPTVSKISRTNRSTFPDFSQCHHPNAVPHKGVHMHRDRCTADTGGIMY